MSYHLPKPVYKPNEEVPVNSRGPFNYYRGVESTLVFTNLSNTTVYVLNRDGTVFEFPPEQAGHSYTDEFLIGKVYRLKGCRFSTGNAADGDPNYAGYSEREEFAKQIDHDKRYDIHDNYNRSYYLKFVYEPSVIKRVHNGSIYVVSMDIVVSTTPPSEGVAHPATLHGTANYFFDGVKEGFSSEGSSIIAIKIVDNFKRYGDQFINVSGQVFRIKAVHDPLFPDGVYIYNTESDKPKPPDYYPFDKVEESALTLYSSYELALSAGDPKSLYENQIRRAKYDYDQLKHEQDLEMFSLKKDYEKEQIKTKTLEESNKRLQEEIDHQRKIERAEYERRKDRRTDQKEDTRWLLGMVTTIFSAAGGALAAYAAIQKSKASNK